MVGARTVKSNGGGPSVGAPTRIIEILAGCDVTTVTARSHRPVDLAPITPARRDRRSHSVKISRPGELAVRAMSSRPATAIVHDVPDVRMLVFKIAPGQSVPLHTNASTVILTVLEGRGRIADADGEQPVTAGSVIAFEPNEPHGMRSVDTEFTLVATISPNPSTRSGAA